tara:strand:- start:9741 stop:10280 length:540 start_codon:yes stop_codon:yes gene_type:complete
VNCGIDPLVIKSNDSIISRFESDSNGQKWWNDYFTKIKEPNLKTEQNESYRLMIYNSMWSSSKTYRIYKDSDSYKLVFKEFGGEQIERENSTLTSSTESDLSKKEWIEFQSLLQNTGFWSLPVTIDRSGLDGITWILEGRNPEGNDCTNREYHIVTRWQPLDNMEVMKLNYKLTELKEK